MSEEIEDMFERVVDKKEGPKVDKGGNIEDLGLSIYNPNSIKEEEVEEDMFDMGIGDIDLGDIDLGGTDLSMDDIDFSVDDLSNLSSIITKDTSNIQSITGLENVNTDLSDEETEYLLNYLNTNIAQYNAMVHAVNLQTRERYESAYDAKEKIEKRKIEDGGKEGYTRETCETLSSLINILSTAQEVTARTIVNRISLIPGKLNSFLWDKITQITRRHQDMGTSYDDSPVLNDEDKKELISEAHKILDTIEPVVISREETIVSNEEYKRQTLVKLSKLEQNMKPVEDIDAIYEIIDIVEYINHETSLSETRYFIEIHAKLAKILTTSMSTGDFNKKYKETIRIRVPRTAPGIELASYQIMDNRVRGKYDTIAKERGIQIVETITKPINYRYKNALVTFSNVGDFEDFEKKAKIKMSILQKERNGVGDTIIGIVAGPENYSERYLSAAKTKTITFPRYTNDDIKTMISGMLTSKYFNDYIRSEEMAIMQRTVLHQFDTPCRRFLLGVLEQFKPNPNILQMYEENKIAILREYLPMAFEYMKNLSKHLYVKVVEEGEKTNRLSTFVDIFIYGRFGGFVFKHMLDRVSGNTISLSEFLEDTESLGLVELSDLVGVDIGEDRDKRISFGRGEMAEQILKAIDTMRHINIGDIKVDNKPRKEKVDMNNSIVMKSINTEEQHIEYLNSLLKAVMRAKNIDTDLDMDSITNKYRESIKPMSKDVDPKDIYYYHQAEGVYNQADEDKENIDTLREILVSNLVKSMEEEDDYKPLELLRDPRTYELIGNSAWEDASILGQDMRDDLGEVLPLVEVIENAAGVIYSILTKMTVEDIVTYEKGNIQRLVGLPTPKQGAKPEQETYSLDLILENPTINVETIVKGLQRQDLPVSIIRDIVVLDKIIGNQNQADRFSSKRSSRMVERALNGQIETTLRLPKIPQFQVAHWDTNKLWKVADSIIRSLCLTTVEYTLILQDIQMRLFYQNQKVAKALVEEELDDYFIEDEGELALAIEYQTLLYWLDAVQVLPIDLTLNIKEEKDAELNRIKGALDRKPPKVESERELALQKKRANAHYKLYLSTGMTKYIEDLDRSHVDFQYLTQQPTADGKPGGEYSKHELVRKYELEEELEGNINDLTYLDVILQIERKYPKIKDELPVTIVNNIEETNTLTVLEQSTIEFLRKDSKFNLNYKIY